MRVHLLSCLCDFRERTPPRPQGQRPEPENRGVSARTSCVYCCPGEKKVTREVSGLREQLCNTSGLVALAACDETITWEGSWCNASV